MAIDVRVPDEITEYREKIVFGLSVRQLFSLMLAIFLCVGTYFLLSKILLISTEFTGYIVMFEAIPIMALGFIRKHGLPFEKWSVIIFNHQTRNSIRLYKTYLEINDQNDVEEDNVNNGDCDEIEEERKNFHVWIFEKIKRKKVNEFGEHFIPTKSNRDKNKKILKKKFKTAKRELKSTKKKINK